MSAETPAPEQSALHRWMWRWHGYAGLFVIPFIFFMALTGLPYVWENELENLAHPEYRALHPQPARVSYEQQLATARAAGGESLLYVKFDGDPHHATQFVFGTTTNPTSVFVNPYSGEIITTMREWTRVSFAAISLHGLTFIEPFGSWLLELLACWGIVLCCTGVYLWWPRGSGSKMWGVFLPRLRAGGRTRWRDLHAVTGFYFAGVLALYLLTGLPWTAFWGGKLLTGIQNATGQCCAATMTADAGLESRAPAPDASRLPLDVFAEFALKQHLPGHLRIELPATPTGTVHIFNRLNRDPVEKHFHLDAFTGQVLGSSDWSDVPLTAKAVALGVNLHEGSLFGRATQILSTALAGVFMLMAGAAAAMWWRRRPQGRLDLPKRIAAPTLPRGVKSGIVILGLALPLLGLSFVLAALARPRAE